MTQDILDGYQDLLDSNPEVADGSALYELAAQWHRLKQDEDAIDAQLKRISELRASVESALFARMDAEQITSFRAPGIGTISQRRDFYPKVIDQDQAMAWLIANGYEEVIKTQINTQRLRGIIKEAQENGGVLPEGVDFWVKESCSLKRAK